MKYLTLLAVIALTGCSSNDRAVQEQKIQNTADKIELAQIQKHGFCEGGKLFSYLETKHYYQWTCNDGRSFMLPKDS